MRFEGWQANTTGEDVASVLRRFGAEDVQTQPGETWPEFIWTSYVDSDEDIVDVLAIMLWYNERTDEEIEAARSVMREWLAKTRGRKSEGQL